MFVGVSVTVTLLTGTDTKSFETKWITEVVFVACFAPSTTGSFRAVDAGDGDIVQVGGRNTTGGQSTSATTRTGAGLAIGGGTLVWFAVETAAAGLTMITACVVFALAFTRDAIAWDARVFVAIAGLAVLVGVIRFRLEGVPVIAFVALRHSVGGFACLDVISNGTFIKAGSSVNRGAELDCVQLSKSVKFNFDRLKLIQDRNESDRIKKRLEIKFVNSEFIFSQSRTRSCISIFRPKRR